MPDSLLAGRQVYSVRDSPLCLTGTAEVPLAAVAMDCVLAEDELPLRLAAFGHCFRTEAGAAGAPAHPCAGCDVAGPSCHLETLMAAVASVGILVKSVALA